jgi:parallel beta-helix repeat protein
MSRNRRPITFASLNLLPTLLMILLLVQPSSSLDSGRFIHSAVANSGASAAFYVNPAGSDAADGSASAPWATIQHAADAARPGTIVHVAPGTYMEAIKTRASGTSDARITFLSQTKWGARIIALNSDSAWENRGDYVDIEGFDITGDGRLGILNLASFVRIMGNHVHHIASKCSNDGGAGIDNGNYGANDNDIIGNVVHDIGDPAVMCKGIQGIYHSNLRGHILSNISYRNNAWGIHLWHAANNVVISNNLVFQNGEGGIVVGDGDSPGGVTDNNTTVSNNIVMDHNSTWGYGIAILEEGYTGRGNKYLNNLIWKNNRGIVLQNGLLAAGTINADPRLVDYRADGTGDYHLSPSSPAIAAGTLIGAPRIDLDGRTRPTTMPPDIGPYQYGTGQAVWPWTY